MELSNEITTLCEGETITYQYEGPYRQWGRLIPRIPYKELLTTDYKIIDMERAFINILWNLCQKHDIDCPIIKEIIYNNYRNFYLWIRVPTFKEKFYSYMFNIKEETDSDSHFVPFEKDIVPFRKEIGIIIDQLKKHYKLEYYYAQQETKNPDHVDNTWFMHQKKRIDTDHLFLYILLTRIEQEIVGKLYNFINEKELVEINVIEYDGLIFKDSSDNYTLLKECNDFIHREYPQNINFKIKETCGGYEDENREIIILSPIIKNNDEREKYKQVLEDLVNFYYSLSGPGFKELFKQYKPIMLKE